MKATKNSYAKPESNYLYFEKQKAKQWWIWLIITMIPAGLLTSLVLKLGFEIEFGNNPASIPIIIISLIFSTILLIGFILMKLELFIYLDKISVRLYPLQLKFKTYSFDEIKNAYIREYSPLLEFGGWGIKGVFDDKCLSLSGNVGLQIEFWDNKKLLIGTQKSKNLKEVLEKLKIAAHQQ
jgi:hypothetical protein